MYHPNRICFTCDVAATSGSIDRRRNTIELVDLMSMMNEDQRLARKCGHQYVTYFLHSGTVLFIGVVYFPEYVDDNELRFACLKGLCEKLMAFFMKNINPRRIVFRMQEVEVIWERDPGGHQVYQSLTPDSLASIELEIEDVGLPTGAPKELSPSGDSVSDLKRHVALATLRGRNKYKQSWMWKVIRNKPL